MLYLFVASPLPPPLSLISPLGVGAEREGAGRGSVRCGIRLWSPRSTATEWGSAPVRILRSGSGLCCSAGCGIPM
eukprot:3092374-Pyramimonas_sp.AAC.1